jgi:uncharacterized protein (DUF488 family)
MKIMSRETKMNSGITLYTIGFTKKNAEKFFTLLNDNGVKRIIDIRLNNTSQLAGFAKADDLKYLLKEVAGIEYVYVPEMAPTKDLLEEYKKNNGDWDVYEREFNKLLEARKVENLPIIEHLDNGCLLCSEDRPAKCHRRLTAEYLAEKLGGIEVRHLY